MLLRDRTLFKGNRHHISNLFLSGFGKKKKKKNLHAHTHSTEWWGKEERCEQQPEVRAKEGLLCYFCNFPVI